MNIITYGFPLSLFLWVVGAMVGTALSFVLFGTLSLIILIICYAIGMIQIKPLIEKIQAAFQYMFPTTLKNIKDNMKLSFPITFEKEDNDLEKSGVTTDTGPNTGTDSDAKANTTAHADTNANPSIYIWHPHGLFSCANFYHCASGQTEFFRKSRTRSVVHHYMKYIPFSQEILSMYNIIFSDYDSMKNTIEAGDSIGIVLGGASEITLTEPNTMKLSIQQKRGIFRLALSTGTPIVPVLVYGENELFQLSKHPIVEFLQYLVKPLHVVVPVPTYESAIQWASITQEPLRKPVQTVVGPAIHVSKVDIPTHEDIEKLRATYFEALRALYDRTKPASYAPLEIV